MLDLFYQVQENVKQAARMHFGPTSKEIATKLLVPTLGGAAAGAGVGGIAGAASSPTPEAAELDALKGAGIGALGGAALGLGASGLANRGALKEFLAMRRPNQMYQGAWDLAEQSAEAASAAGRKRSTDPGAADLLERAAERLRGEAETARGAALQARQQFLEKGAEDERRRSVLDRLRGRKKYHYLFGKRIGDQEAENIAETLKKKRPRTQAEKQIQDIVGARPTQGQMIRHGAVGALGGIGTHLLGSAIEGGNKWAPDLSEGVVKGLLKQKEKAVLHPRSLLRAATVGGILAGAVPVTKQLWDIQTARERPEAF